MLRRLNRPFQVRIQFNSDTFHQVHIHLNHNTKHTSAIHSFTSLNIHIFGEKITPMLDLFWKIESILSENLNCLASLKLLIETHSMELNLIY